MEKVHFVNRAKKDRAEYVLGMLIGKITPKNSEEQERMNHWSLVVQNKGINIKEDKKAMMAIYEAMGGLMRTEEEEVKAKTKKKKMMEKGKKDKMGIRG